MAKKEPRSLMKFTISSASDPYVESFAGKPHNRAKLEKFKPVERAVWDKERLIWTIAINSLFELTNIIGVTGHPLVVEENAKSDGFHITIWDDYIE